MTWEAGSTYDPKIELSVEKTAASSHNIGDIAKDISEEQFGTLDF